ncbi:hypothetical protein SAMN05421505_10987 [Sinosporangium album]|uniref:DUF6879 domain-containing protein n=1 Tax=Sinosporangium album TaxID=504805 RepID=A0A1G7Y3K9_9ACTN|nr:DUF6879 family protein [Sinosporangium album]SDG91072.1 hypothetical protein SAMN05421505_10987 [Sinosporangium album]
MPDLPSDSAGERLERPDYRAEFRQRLWALHDDEFWKFERRQSFIEPGVPSWEAFAAGDWQASLDLIADRRTELKDYFQRAAEQGLTMHRLRVVEPPLTPYLQWELHLLNVRAEHGERIRVVSPDLVRRHESEDSLVEVVVLGASTMYRIVYTDDGLGDGAVRFTDSSAVMRCRESIKALFDQGEDLRSYFAREVAHLPPPAIHL